MGTNYYAHVDVCGCCGRAKEKWHLGKSGRTLRFYLHPEPFDIAVTTFQGWTDLVRAEAVEIRDEYDSPVDKEWLIEYFDEHSRRTLVPSEAGLTSGSDAFHYDPEGRVYYTGEFC